MPSVSVKICGMVTPQDVAASVDAGADYLGFVFFERSPRNLSISQARTLTQGMLQKVGKVALLVNPTDAFVEELCANVPIDLLQLHGSETPARVAQIRAKTGVPVMKALGVADQSDLSAIDKYAEVADQILVDAKPPKGGDLPGGNGLSFDWRLIADRTWSQPWMLAGGLSEQNVSEAIKRTSATQVDVSSGVETAPGQKDAKRIRAFVKAAKATQG